MDLTETREAYESWREKFAARGITLHAVSAATRDGLPEILEALWPLVRPPVV